MIETLSQISIHYDFTDEGWNDVNNENLMDAVDKLTNPIKNAEVVYFGGNSVMNPYLTVTIPHNQEVAEKIEKSIQQLINNSLLIHLLD